jgi:hypothetical protein
LVVGQVKRKAAMASLPCSSIGRNGGRGPVCPGGRERPGRQVARYVSTLWSCDRPGLIWRKSGPPKRMQLSGGPCRPLPMPLPVQQAWSPLRASYSGKMTEQPIQAPV